GLAIHHVIAVPAPRIEHDRALAHGRREQPRGGREAVRAGADGRRTMGHDLRLPGSLSGRHASASCSIRPAVALAEPTTPGTPAPGWVPAPTMYRLGISASRLCGRNHALWVSTGSSEKAEPWCAFSSV